jgi:acyl-CoA thioesterase-1
VRRVSGSAGRTIAAAALLAGTIACGSRDDPPARHEATSVAASTAAAPRPVSDAPTSVSAEARVVVLGDSLTAGLGLAVDEAYPALLERRLTAAGFRYHVVNAGISGDTSAGGVSRLESALEGNVRILIVALGANDGLRGLPPEQLKQNLSQIIERAQARGISVILAGMEAPPNFGAEYTTAFHNIYPALAKQYHLPLVPFLLAGVAGVPELNQRDQMHPTAEGDRIVADTVWKALEPVAKRLAGRGEGSPGS